MPLRHGPSLAAVAALLICLAVPAPAQQPTQEQISAIRSACRSDFLSNCSGVPRGGPEAVRCLKDHLAKLSPACNAAVSAITPAPAPKVAAPPPPPPAAPPPAPATAAAPPALPNPAPTAVQPAAPPPVAAPATPPAPPATRPSVATAPATSPAPAKTPPAPPASAQKPAPKSAQPAAPPPAHAATAAPPAPPPAPAPAASLLPLPPLAPRVRLMIVRACSAEHRAVCGNVPAGGGIVECLAEHADALSPPCRDAILAAKR